MSSRNGAKHTQPIIKDERKTHLTGVPGRYLISAKTSHEKQPTFPQLFQERIVIAVPGSIATACGAVLRRFSASNG
jgi:hypothetical protein